MGTPDPRIERWLSKDRPWRDELAALRDILLAEELTEALKWRQPCYIAHGGNVAILASLADSVAVSFFKGVLLDDPERRLESPGPNSRSAMYMKFDGLEAIRSDSDLLRGFLRQAIENENAGRKVDLPKDDIIFPDELVEAMGEDPELAEAFAALTPGRQRGWALHVSGAKLTKTRHDRIAKARPAILAGKGMHDR
jgi:uncharacterized protein YdeI (YjbR/CyaY-like superfamily)